MFEDTVVGAYNLGKLDEDLLDVLMEPHRGTDIDSGGKTGLLSKDGKEAEQIVIETLGMEMPVPPTFKRPAHSSNMTDKQREQEEAWDEYDEALWSTFHAITRDRYGWE